jgi:RimJ/RimL family protein N-acetyltransferase
LVTLRALEPDDFDTMLSWIDSADALFQWSGAWDFRWPLDRSRLRRDLAAAGEGRRLFAAVREGDLAGHVMLTIQPEHGLGVIGRVLVDPARRGGGVGTALMREIVRIGFDELGLHRLQLAVYDFNQRAIACYRRVGFVIEGRLRDATRGSEGYWTAYVMAMLEPEYRMMALLEPEYRTMALLEPEYRNAGGPVPDGIRLRPAGITDAPALADLLTQLGYPQVPEQTRAQLAQWAGHPLGAVLVAEVDGSVAGVIAAHALPYLERPGSFARVVALAVDQHRRRGGVGRRLLAAVEAWAVGIGCREIEITSRRSREDAQAFYRAAGFEDLCERSARFKRPLAGGPEPPRSAASGPRAP